MIGFVVVLFRPLPWYVAIILATPALLDGGTQLLHWRTSTNWLRLTTGLLAGIGEMILLLLLAHWAIHLGYVTGTKLIVPQ